MKICGAGRLRVGRSPEVLRQHVVPISGLVALWFIFTKVKTVPLLRGATRLVPWRVRDFSRPKTGWDRFRSLPTSDWWLGSTCVGFCTPGFGWGAWARSASTCVATHLSYEGTRSGSDVDSSASRLLLRGPPPLAWRRFREVSCDTGRLRVLAFPHECCNSLSRDSRPSARS